ncbi:unnamed protein product [Leuciscus chuanchicus]
MRRTDERWTRIVTVWLPIDIKRPRGRPATRWRDSLRQDLGHNWMRLAQDRQTWADCCDEISEPRPCKSWATCCRHLHLSTAQ